MHKPQAPDVYHCYFKYTPSRRDLFKRVSRADQFHPLSVNLLTPKLLTPAGLNQIQ
jgi:hypothetical protein